MPLDLFGDPFGGGLYGQPPNPFLQPRRPAVPQTPVLPEDESTLLGSLMERGLGGLAFVGKVLDKTFGGRAVRGGILSGNPRELLSVLPFSDSLGITDERDVVHGKDLLTDAGFLTKGDDSLENVVAGVGTDILLDPAVWVGAAVPRAVLGGLNRVGRPLAQGAGNLVERASFGTLNPYTFAQNVGDNAARVGSALFDTTVHGAWMKEGQSLGREVFDPALKAGQQAARDTMVNPLVDLAPLARTYGDEVIGRGGIQAAEGYGPEAINRLVAAGVDPLDAMSVVNTASKYGDTVRATRAAENARGINTQDLLDVPRWQTEANERLVHEPARLANQEANRLAAVAARTNDPADLLAAQQAAAEAARLSAVPELYDTAAAMPYFPRTPAQWADLGVQPPSTGVSGGLSAKGGPLIQREDFLRGIPGGTEGVNDLVRNAAFSGRGRTMTDLAVENEMSRRLTGFNSGAMPQGFRGDDIAWSAAQKQAKEISDWLRELPPQAQQAGMFAPDFVGAGFKRLDQSARMQASAAAVAEGARRFARPVADLEREGVRYVRVGDMLNDAGLTFADPVSGRLVAHEAFAVSRGVPVQAVNDLAVPLDVAADMARLGRAYTTPGVLAPVVEAWDKVTNFFKTALTTLFPAFHSRNLMSGLFNQWRDGALSNAALGEALSVIRGGGLSAEAAGKLFPGMTVEAANSALLKEAIAHKVAFVREARQTSDAVGQLASRPAGMMPSQVPDVSRLRPVSEDLGTFAEGFKGGGPRDTTWRDPLGVAGVRGDVDTFVPVVQGRKVGNTVEDFNRLSHYISRRTMGDPPEVAAAAVRKYQIDYSRATGFEQAVMKRVFPWYSFSAGNLPPLLADLASKPGKLAGTMHVVTGSREPGEFVPPWIAEGAAVPFPFNEQEGQKRFVSSFGLPVEDELVKTIGAVGQGDIGRVFQQLFGMSQPFVKLPAELATGTQMYSGRKLEDLRPYEFASLGGLLPQDAARQVSQVVANTPLSRFGSTLDKFIDDRKGTGEVVVNTLSGGRITDVDVDKVYERAAQEQLKKMLRGQPGVKARDEVYVPKDQIRNLTPDDLMTYSLLKEIEARSQRRNREEKKRAGQ
jgi:hypothetical protein